MTNLFTSKTNFSAGELSQDLLGRVDLTAYENGAFALKNVFLEATGGIHRRSGLKYISDVEDFGRLIAFEPNKTQHFLLLIQDEATKIFQDDVLITTLTTPWTDDQIRQLCWCQISDGFMIVHPDVAPQKLVYTNNTWQIVSFAFLVEDGCIYQPYVRFAGDDVTLSSSGCSGTVTLTTSAATFENRHVGQQFKIGDGYAQIQSVTDSTHATAVVKKKLLDADGVGANTRLDPTRSWGEPAFCSAHGWPRTVCTYQSRLVFGGSRDLPNTLWFSQTGDITNFEQGSGYDSEAIEFKILSDQSDYIAALFAGRHLQVFTASAEWMVSGDPLTPADIQLKRQTQVGSRTDLYVPPLGIDGATIFAGANGREIREFLFSDLEGIYQARDISLLSKHLIQHPLDMAYDKYERQAYLVMSNGSLVVLTSFRSEDIQSWTEQITDGQFLSVALLGEKAYFVIQRDEAYSLECFDPNLHTDSGHLISSDTPVSMIENLDHLEGKTVALTTDGIVLDPQVVENGCVFLLHDARKIEVGLPFTHQVIPLPPAAAANNGNAPVTSCRLVRAVFRLIDTQSLEIDTGTGVHQEMVPDLAAYKLDSPATQKTKDLVLRSLGWMRSPTSPLWEIRGSSPQPFRLVSVVSDIKLGG
ncbi:MAG: hypothetical protein II942_04080 [Alphaproteobacteria bacterium]|nr:hypothetical protein [Alphaproteobacteria bacterium]